LCEVSSKRRCLCHLVGYLLILKTLLSMGV